MYRILCILEKFSINFEAELTHSLTRRGKKKKSRRKEERREEERREERTAERFLRRQKREWHYLSGARDLNNLGKDPFSFLSFLACLGTLLTLAL